DIHFKCGDRPCNALGLWEADWSAGPPTVLFVAKRLDGIEIGGAIGWVETEADPDCRTDKKTGKRPAVRENYVHLEPRCEQIASDDSENDSQNTASLGNENGLGQELPQNIVAAGTDRFADADFLCAFGHAHQHDVHDADSCRDTGDETYDERAHSDIAR